MIHDTASGADYYIELIRISGFVSSSFGAQVDYYSLCFASVAFCITMNAIGKAFVMLFGIILFMLTWLWSVIGPGDQREYELWHQKMALLRKQHCESHSSL